MFLIVYLCLRCDLYSCVFVYLFGWLVGGVCLFVSALCV